MLGWERVRRFAGVTSVAAAARPERVFLKGRTLPNYLFDTAMTVSGIRKMFGKSGLNI